MKKNMMLTKCKSCGKEREIPKGLYMATFCDWNCAKEYGAKKPTELSKDVKE